MLRHFHYDEAGRLIQRDNVNGTITQYGYDKASRLTSLKNRKSDGTPIAAYDYTLDANGNITKAVSFEPQVSTPTPEDTSYLYNTNGNRLESVGAKKGARHEKGTGMFEVIALCLSPSGAWHLFCGTFSDLFFGIWCLAPCLPLSSSFLSFCLFISKSIFEK